MRKIPSIQQTQPKSLKLTPAPYHVSMTNDLSVQVLGTSVSCNRRKKTFLNTSLIVNCDKTEDIKSLNNRGFPTFYMYIHVFKLFGITKIIFGSIKAFQAPPAAGE